MDPDQVRKKPSATWFSSGCFLALLMLIVLIPAMAFLIWMEQRSREAARRLAAIREQGMPITYADLNEYYELPRGEPDTARLWLDGVQPLLGPAAAQAAKSIPIVGTGRPPPLGQPWPEIDKSAAFLAQHAISLEKFHEAARLGGAARFPIDYSRGIPTDWSHLQNQRAAARLLALAAQVHAHRGDASRCAESIHGLFGAEHSTRHNPSLVAYLLNLALRGMAVDAVAETVGGVPFTEQELRQFQVEIRARNAGEFLIRGLAAERAFAYQGISSQNRIPFWNPDFAFMLETFDEIQSAAALEFPGALDELTVVQAKVNSGAGWPGSTRTLMALLVPAIQASFSATARTLGNERACDASIAIVLFQRRTGELPDTLAELTPDLIPHVPLDPFDGQPLRYRTVENGFVVYSIGSDRKDDGGIPALDPATDDVLFVRTLLASPPSDNGSVPANENKP